MNSDLEELGEFGIIDLFRREATPRQDWLAQGIGDDCALFDLGNEQFLLATKDMLLEGRHFDRGLITPFQLGWKSLAVNLSDIAAMGGIPRAALLGLGLPAAVGKDFLVGLHKGLAACASAYAVDIAGGDTVASAEEVVISVTMLGGVAKREVVRRSGARPGDGIYLGREVGDSAAGLHLLKQAGGQGEAFPSLIKAHLEPDPQVDLGRELASAGLASAMIDVSDGVAADLGHICTESSVGAVIDLEALPISAAAQRLAEQVGVDPFGWALCGGEDYCLLFCGNAEVENKLSKGITRIGEITMGEKVVCRKNGKPVGFECRGFDHFAK